MRRSDLLAVLLVLGFLGVSDRQGMQLVRYQLLFTKPQLDSAFRAQEFRGEMM